MTVEHVSKTNLVFNDPVMELYTIQHTLTILHERLEDLEYCGEAYIAKLLGKSVRAVAEKLANEDWKATQENCHA